jgi:sugar phosphate isomerase/epimerase
MMPRPIILHTGSFADLPVEDLAARAASWSYSGLEVSTTDHIDVRQVLDDGEYVSSRLGSLAGHDLQAPVISIRRNELVSADDIVHAIRAAQRLGAMTVSGCVGSPLPGWAPTGEQVERAFHAFAAEWHPILDVCQETGIRFAGEVCPGQLAFDFHSAERLLDAIDRRPEFGICVNPAHLHWQGVDVAAFIRHFGDRVYHVHLCDVAIMLDGKSSLLNSYFECGDPRRGCEFRAAGRGGVDWENFARALNAVNYDGPLSVDGHDAGMDRDFGAEDAARFAKQLDYPGKRREEAPAFR